MKTMKIEANPTPTDVKWIVLVLMLTLGFNHKFILELWGL